MYASSDPDHLILLHLSKTGGTSLGVALRLIYGYRHSLQVGGKESIKHYRQLPSHKRKGVYLLKGHVPFGTHRHCPGTTRYITLLREPVARIDSFHRMLLEEYTRTQFSLTSLSAYVNDGHRTYTHNAQLRNVVGINTDESVNQRTLERAKDILDEYFVVAGITERFDASVLLMKECLGWSWPPFYVRSRTGSKDRKRSIPDRVRRIIREQNEWDVRLYEYVSDRLDAEIERRGDTFRRRVRRFQKFNWAFATIARRPLQLFRTAREWGKARGLFSSLR